MRRVIERLQNGTRWWAAEVVFRCLAALLFAAAALCARGLEHRVMALPSHQATPAEFGLAAAGVMAGAAGLACLVEGPGLFRLVPFPRRRLF